MKRIYFEPSSRDRRDVCLFFRNLMLVGVHAGTRRCTDVMKDEKPFKLVTPFSSVRERNVRIELLKQYRDLRDSLSTLLDFPDYQMRTCLRFDNQILPDGINEAYLFSGREGHRYLLAITGDSCVLIDRERIKISSAENIPNSLQTLLDYLRAKSKLQCL